MSMYKLIEYSDNYSKTSRILWQYCRDEPVLHANNAITDFNATNATSSSVKIKEKTGHNGTENVAVMVP